MYTTMFLLHCLRLIFLIFLIFPGIYNYVHELILDYKKRYGDLSVTFGTVYDYDNDGLWEGVTNETQ